MALNIGDAELERPAATLAKRTGDVMTGVVRPALSDRLVRVSRQRTGRGLADQLRLLARDCASLSLLDARSADGILGCDDRGLPR